MVAFSYRVLNRHGEVQTGTIEAISKAAATAELYQAGCTPLDVTSDRPSLTMRLNQPVTFFSAPSERDIQAFLRDLGRLLTAGLSMDDALKLLQEMQTRDLLARAIETIRDRVRRGESLATALGAYDRYFNIQVIAAVRAGELSGTLNVALATIAQAMDQALSFKERVRGALIYPAILMVMVAATFILVITFVLPQFAPLFLGNEDKLPWATRFVMGLGSFMTDQWYIAALPVILLLGGAVIISRSVNRRRQFLSNICKIPGLKTWILTPDVVRFVRTLGVCTKSGVPLDQALSMSIDAVRLPHVSETLVEVRQDVRRGGLLSTALQKTPLVPVLVLQFARVGEQSGRLGPMLDEAAEIIAQDYEKKLEKSLEVLSPILTLVMGGVVALLVGSVLLGIMSINDVAL